MAGYRKNTHVVFSEVAPTPTTGTTDAKTLADREGDGVWVDDERVLCSQCDNAMMVECKQSMPVKALENMRKDKKPAVRWFDGAMIKNGWATVTWQQQQCSKTNLPTLDIKHRCHLYSKLNNPVVILKSDEWWID